MSATLDDLIAREHQERARRLAFIRSRLTPRGGTWTGAHGLTYHAHPNTHQNRAQYPWQLTTLRTIADTLTPISHTAHEALDLPEDQGPYYRSVTHELTYSVAMPHTTTDEEPDR